MSNPIVIPIIKEQQTQIENPVIVNTVNNPNLSKINYTTIFSQQEIPVINKKENNIDVPVFVKQNTLIIGIFQTSTSINVVDQFFKRYNIFSKHTIINVPVNVKRIIENISFGNVFIHKDIYSQEANIISSDLATKVKLILDEDNMINLGTIVLQAVYNEYYPELFKLGSQYISRFKDIQPVDLPPFIHYNKYEHKFSGTINVTKPVTFRIIFDSTYYVTININVSVREIQ